MTLLLDYPQPHIAKISLNRPEKHNAFNDSLIKSLNETLLKIENDPNIRVVLLTAEGRNFSAGADLEWMQRMVNYSKKQNLEDAIGLARLLHTLNNLRKPTIAVAQGAAYGGGVGLLACCDIVIASEDSYFCFSEVKLGLIPATIAPYVVAAIGERAARRYFLTAEQFTAQKALELGLIHFISGHDKLQDKALEMATVLLHNSPQALAATKQLLQRLSSIDEKLIADTAELIAQIRTSEEGQAGLKAFLAKEKPPWLK
jgi:methylglutaconyl-CoA hydratase